MKYYICSDPNFLVHHGIKGMKWGVRRYQNYDGSLKAAGRAHVNTGLSMPKPSMHSEKYDPNTFEKKSTPRHQGKNPRRQSFKNTVYGTLSGHYLRNKLNKDLPKNDADAKAQGWRKLSAKDSAMHQFYKEDGVRNTKWVSPDGHREVVFTGKGENQHRTTHAEDAGTYNFFDPKKHPIGHATLDVLPYVFLGNSADDSTTMVTRLSESYKNFKNKTIDTIDDATQDIGEDFAKKHKIA